MNQIWNLRKNCPVGAVPKSINCKLWVFWRNRHFCTLRTILCERETSLFQKNPTIFTILQGVGNFQNTCKWITFIRVLIFSSQGQHPLTSAITPALLPDLFLAGRHCQAGDFPAPCLGFPISRLEAVETNLTCWNPLRRKQQYLLSAWNWTSCLFPANQHVT